MATRFYLPSTGASAINPGPHSSWGYDFDDFGTGYARKAAVDTRGTTAMTTVSSGTNTDLNAYDMCGHTWVFGPIAAVTISGNVSCRIRGRADTFNDLWTAALCLYIAKPDATVRATLKNATDLAGEADEWSTSFANYTYTGIAVTSGAALDGDYLVIEVGAFHDAAVSSDGCDLEIGDTDASNHMYVEFTETITLGVEPTTLSYDYADSSQLQMIRDYAGPTHTPTTDGVGGLTYTVQSGALPTGLALNASTGLITGTPTVNGSYSATIRVTNSMGFAEATLSWKVGRLGGGWTPDIRL